MSKRWFKCYKDDQDAFEGIAQKVLGDSYAGYEAQAKSEASQAFHSCRDKLKRGNTSRIAFNRVIAGAMREAGVSSWREYMRQQDEQNQSPTKYVNRNEPEEPTKAGKTKSGTAARKPGGKLIIDMIEGK